MAKRSNEHPKIMMKRVADPHAFVPAMPWCEELLQHYPIGSVVEVQVWQGRSPDHLKLYWVILHSCVDNSENKYGRAEDLHDALKIALGYTRKVKMLGVGPGAVILKQMLAVLNGAKEIMIPPQGTKATALRVMVDVMVAKAIGMAEQLYEHIGDTIVMPGSIAMDRMDQAEFKVFFERAMNELRNAGYPVDDIMAEGQRKLAHLKASNPYHDSNEGVSHGRGPVPRRGDLGTEAEPETARPAT